MPPLLLKKRECKLLRFDEKLKFEIKKSRKQLNLPSLETSLCVWKFDTFECVGEGWGENPLRFILEIKKCVKHFTLDAVLN